MKRRIGTVVAVVVGGLVVLNLLAQGFDRAVGGNEPKGANNSSYSTTELGLGAYASLLAQYRFDVRQERGPIAGHRPPTNDTVVVVDPSAITDDDLAVLLEFVTNGGRLVIGGQTPFYLHSLRDRPPVWSDLGRSPWTDVDPAFGGGTVRSIETASEGSWSFPGTSRAVVGNAQRSLLTSERVGQGQILFLADPSPLQNAYLDRADNAAFALALAGSPDRPVVFAEGVHGYGESRGIAAIPSRWKWALFALAAAALAFVWSRARRFGPPDRASRALPPARAEYVHALSLTLARTRDPATAFAPMQRFARDRLAARVGLPGDADDDDVALAAREMGYRDDEIEVLLTPPRTNEAAMTLGRVLARVAGDGRDG
jgi:hypothetical protein